MNSLSIRFYEELNDFLPNHRKKSCFLFYFNANPAVKDVIESLGVPHVEVDFILVNSESVDFSYHVKQDDYISVYPVFESFDIRDITKLKNSPLRKPKFILDVHLGKLARFLRLLGFDCLYQNNYEDAEIAEIAYYEERIILTKDTGLLKRKIVSRGYFIRSSDPFAQIKEVMFRFDLYKLAAPFKYCMKCNGNLVPADKDKIREQLKPNTALYYNSFYQCGSCGSIYWQGSHFTALEKIINTCLLKEKINNFDQ